MEDAPEGQGRDPEGQGSRGASPALIKTPFLPHTPRIPHLGSGPALLLSLSFFFLFFLPLFLPLPPTLTCHLRPFLFFFFFSSSLPDDYAYYSHPPSIGSTLHLVCLSCPADLYSLLSFSLFTSLPLNHTRLNPSPRCVLPFCSYCDLPRVPFAPPFPSPFLHLGISPQSKADAPFITPLSPIQRPFPSSQGLCPHSLCCCFF